MTEMCENTEDADHFLEAMIMKHREFLIENIDSEFGLLDDLRQNMTLSWRETEDIDRMTSPSKKNEALINAILARKHFGNFKNALKNNQQSHVISYLLSDGIFRKKSLQEWPLTKNERDILTQNYKTFVDLLDISELIHDIFSEGVISERQRDYISSKETSADRNKALLEILRRKSLKDYEITTQCLRSTKQGHLAEILAKGGATVRVDFSVSEEVLNEDDTKQRIKDMLINRSQSEKRKIFGELYDLCFIGEAKDNRIPLYFHPVRSANVKKLEKVAASGRLAASVETVLNRLFSSAKKISVKFDRIVTQNSQVTEEDVTTGAMFSTAKFDSVLELGKNVSDVDGITKLKNKIYVLTQVSHSFQNMIFVFDDRSRLLDKIELAEIDFAAEIAPNERDNCLYINQFNAIWKITEEIDEHQQKRHKVIRWLEMKSCSNNLSTTNDGRMLIVAEDLPITLSIYGSDAQLLSAIKLREDIAGVARAVEASDGNLIILHQLRRTNYRDTCICVITLLNVDGETIIRRFIPENEEQELCALPYFTIDSQNRIFVADRSNNRVILFESDLTWNRILLQKAENEIKKKGKSCKRTDSIPDHFAPGRLFYDDRTKQLFVGGNNSLQMTGAVFIYSL